MTDFKMGSAADLPLRIILSISSDFGVALATAWLDRGLKVAGTYRRMTPAVEALAKRGAVLVPCDLARKETIDAAIAALCRAAADWDVLVVAPGCLEPVARFVDCEFDAWEASVGVNFSAPLRFVHGLLPARRRASERGPLVLFFAGGGANGPVPHYSAYTVSKIASIKMVELLDAEIPDTRFTILGPGWVKTKIHQSTIDAGVAGAGDNYENTLGMLSSDECSPIVRVVECCEWIIGAPRRAIGGRNISLVHDHWTDPKLLDLLAADPHMYKLRRFGNERWVEGAEAVTAPGPAEQLARLFDALPALADRLVPSTPIYRAFAAAARNAIVPLFGPASSGPQPFGPFGNLILPYRRMGAIDSLDLFGLDELIIFAFYWANRGRYRRVADIGANIGLHSLILARCGYAVRSYEPDPVHLALLKENLVANSAAVEIVPAAVSDRSGRAEFVRVLGNTTGSHLAGAKANPYGDLERFMVPIVPIAEIIAWADLMKIDAEGHEAAILLSTAASQWDKTDAMVEIGSEANACAIFEHCRQLGLNLFAQKLGWARARSAEETPGSYKEGSAFISRKAAVPGLGDR